MAAAAAAAPKRAPRWLTLLRVRETWGLVTAKFLSDAAWYLYLFWLPKYLYDARGFDIKAVGAFAWIPMPPPASAVSSAAGCRAICWTRDLPLDRARKIALGLSAAVMPAVLFVPNAPGRLGAGDLQPRVFRPAIVVDARDDPSRRHVSAQRRRRRRRPGRFRRRDGRRGVRAGGRARCSIAASDTVSCSRLPARSTCWRSSSSCLTIPIIRPVSLPTTPSTPTTPVSPSLACRNAGSSHEDHGDPHARRAVARQDRAAAAAFLHQPDGPAVAAAGRRCRRSRFTAG